MASLRTAMDAQFWDLGVSSPESLAGAARWVPGEPPPPPLARAPRTSRPQQLTFLTYALPLCLVPSVSNPPPPAAVGGGRRMGDELAVQSILALSGNKWWTGLVGQIRPTKLISTIKKEIAKGEPLGQPLVMNFAKLFRDKAFDALGVVSQISLMPNTSLLFNVERRGEKKKICSKAMFFHKLPDHDVTVEAAWPELFLDRKGTYWEVPTSLSLDISSLISDSGFRYRFGLHKNGGQPQALSSPSAELPESLMPGICAKAAFSFEKSKDIWREKEEKLAEDLEIERIPPKRSYDVQLSEPHVAISGIFGGSCAAWIGRNKKDHAVEAQSGNFQSDDAATSKIQKCPFSADLFGSLGYTIQHGKFENDFKDLTRIDARLDISSAAAFFKDAARLGREVNPLASPRLNVMLQQQVAGPVVLRVDSRISLPSLSGKHKPCIEDVICGLSYSFKIFQSGKILAWYSPKRREGMVELRIFEF